MHWKPLAVIVLAGALSLAACSETIRRSGQVELFNVDSATDGDKRFDRLSKPKRTANEPSVTFDQARIGAYARVNPHRGDLVRFTSDTVTVVVPTIYLDHIPSTLGKWVLTNPADRRYDVMLFSEVWENAAVARSEPPLNRVVYIAQDQAVPGRLNFRDAIAYGPTTFKGHPIRIKFTLVLLQRESKKSADTAAKSIESYIALAGAGTPTGAAASTVVALIRQIIRSLPDVEAFDFEVTMMPYRPPSTVDSVGVGAPALAEQVRQIRRVPTPASAQRLGMNVEARLDQFQAHERARVENTAKQLEASVAQSDFHDAAEMARRLLEDFKPDGVDVKGERILPNAIDPEWTEQHPDDVKMLASAVLKSLPERQNTEFKGVREAVNDLANAETDKDVVNALDKLTSCRDYGRLEPHSSIDHEMISREINARPWFRYGMYALVETAHYEPGRSKPENFSMDSNEWLNDRLTKVESSEHGDRGPNYMLFDVIPGLQASDDTILRATSAAAERFFEASGYTSSQRLLEDPERLTQRMDSIEADLLETIVLARANNLALEMAQEQERAGASRAMPFEEQGTFNDKFEILVAAMPVDAEARKRLNHIRDRVRKQFLARFQ